MKLFLLQVLKKGFLFIALIALKIIVQDVCFSYTTKKYVGDRVIIEGNSHIQRINDETIGNAINLSQSGQTYEVSYHKIQSLLAYGVEPNTIIMELAPFNVSHCNNEIYDTDQFLKTLSGIPWYYLIANDDMSIQQKFKVLKYKVYNIERKNPIIGKHYCAKNYKDVSLEESNKWVKKKYRSLDEGEKNMSFLYKTLDIAEKKQIKVTLIRLPLHPDAEAMIPNEYIAAYKEQMALIKQQYPNLVTFLDFTDEFKKPLDFIDRNHLTCTAADILSNKIRTLLKH